MKLTSAFQGYWQIAIPGEDIPKTASLPADGLYEFLLILIRMVNSAAMLKRAMKKLLWDLANVEFYWDDILVHTHMWKEHLTALQKFFMHLLQAAITVIPSKCIFSIDSVQFLGH